MSIFDIFTGKKEADPAMERKHRNETAIRELGIACNEHLPAIASASEVQLKNVDVICKRAVACLLSTQVASDILHEEDPDGSIEFFSGLLRAFGAEEALLEKERKLFDKTLDHQGQVDILWSYECYWALAWTLGLIDDADLKAADAPCDPQRAISFGGDCNDLQELKAKTSPRDIESVLDMLDLFYRYHWACVQKQIKPETEIGNLQPEVVMERRRGLEWLVSSEVDWNEIRLDT